MLKNNFLFYISLLLLMNSSCSKKVSGTYQADYQTPYQAQFGKALYEIELRRNGKFTFVKYTQPASSNLEGLWHVKGDTLVLEEIMENREVSDTLSGKFRLPIRINYWKINLKDFGVFKIKGKTIETTNKGDKLTFLKYNRLGKNVRTEKYGL